jgi:glutamate racemase
LDEGADRIVLGCTHYPFLSETIAKIAAELYPEREIEIIDPAPAVARHLADIMKTEALIHNEGFSIELNSSGDNSVLNCTFDRLQA